MKSYNTVRCVWRPTASDASCHGTPAEHHIHAAQVGPFIYTDTSVINRREYPLHPFTMGDEK